MGKSKWNAKSFFICVIFAAATFAASFILGGSITLAFGPGTSGIFTIIITTILVVICANIVEKAGTFTITVTLFTVLATPTTIFGPPGPQKIFIGLITGFVYDMVWLLTRKNNLLRKYSFPIAAALSTAVSIILIFQLMVYLGHPKADFMKKILYYLIPLYAILGAVGGWLGNKIYTKTLSGLSIVQQFKS